MLDVGLFPTPAPLFSLNLYVTNIRWMLFVSVTFPCATTFSPEAIAV